MSANYCVVIPTYDNPLTLEAVVERVREHVADVIVVDDGSGEEARAVARSLQTRGRATVFFRETNGGKGAAVLSGLAVAKERGFSHALQLDADGQHDTDDIPRFIAASKSNERALVLGQPVFDSSAPRGRLWGRKVSVLFCAIETMSARVGDPLCGFRVYPVGPTLATKPSGRVMDFDPEIAVRLAWAGLPILHVSTRVKYIGRDEGGVSHYRGFADTLKISLMHTRLCIEGVFRVLTGQFGRRLPAGESNPPS